MGHDNKIKLALTCWKHSLTVTVACDVNLTEIKMILTRINELRGLNLVEVQK